MAIMVDSEKSSLLRAAPRLIQILRVLARHKFLGALRGKGHWPSPKKLREAFEELGLTFLKFGQVSAMRRDLLPDASSRVFPANASIRYPGIDDTGTRPGP